MTLHIAMHMGSVRHVGTRTAPRLQAFDKCYDGSIKAHEEDDGTSRIEITCAGCAGHLGHVFKGEGFTETGERHCANSRSLQFVKGKIDKAEVKLNV